MISAYLYYVCDIGVHFSVIFPSLLHLCIQQVLLASRPEAEPVLCHIILQLSELLYLH